MAELDPNIRGDYYAAEEKTFESVFGAASREYYIPSNQRPWSWKADDLLLLWTDLKDTVSKFYERTAKHEYVLRSVATGNPHFFGAFVFKQITPSKWEVVDGQQRFTALMMLLAIFRELYRDIELSSADSGVVTEARKHGTVLESWIYADHLSGTARLQLDDATDRFFKDYLVDAVDAKARQAAARAYPVEGAAKLLKHDFDAWREVITTECAALNKGERLSLLHAAMECVRHGFLVIEVVVKNDLMAFEVFRCLNATGVPLSECDKIKNELFLRAPLTTHTSVKSSWDSLAKTVPHGDVGAFLRFRHIAFIGEVKKSKLHPTIVKKELSGHIIADVLTRWNDDAALMSKVALLRHHGFAAGTREVLEDLGSTLRISYGLPFLTAAAREYLGSSPNTFAKAARLALNFCFRTRTIGNQDTPFLEDKLGLAARSIGKKSLRLIAKDLLKANPDSVFEERFAMLDRAVSTKIAFYVLREIEIHLKKRSGVVPLPHGARQHVEHIMPRNLSKAAARRGEWRQARRKPDKHDAYKGRLGNLLILESDINSEVSNYDFDAKAKGAYPGAAKQVWVTNSSGARVKRNRLHYGNSGLELARRLAAFKGTSWGFKEIDERQRELAAISVRVWPLTVK